MTKSKLISTLIFILSQILTCVRFQSAAIAAPSNAATDNLSVEQIMSANEATRKIYELTAQVVLTTTTDDKPNSPDEKKFTYYRKLNSNQERFKTLTRFTTPATIKNQAILFLEQDNYKSDVFLYLPTFKKVRRVESHSQNSAFMGSAFSYSDIAIPLSKDFNHRLIKKENCPSGIYQQKMCYHIESTPKTDEVKIRIGAEKTIQWIETQQLVTVQWDFYGVQNEPLKKIKASQYSNGLKSNTYFAQKVEIHNYKAKKSTTLFFSELDMKSKIDDSFFTQQSLSREK